MGGGMGLRRRWRKGVAVLLSLLWLGGTYVPVYAAAQPSPLRQIEDLLKSGIADTESWLPDMPVPIGSAGEGVEYEEQQMLLANISDAGDREPTVTEDTYLEEHGASSTMQPFATEDLQLVGKGQAPSVSDDGAYVAFETIDRLAVEEGDMLDTNSHSDIYVYDQALQALRQITGIAGGVETPAYRPVLSMDGRTLLFAAEGQNESTGYYQYDLYRYDMGTAAAVRVARGVGVKAGGSGAFNSEASAYAVSAARGEQTALIGSLTPGTNYEVELIAVTEAGGVIDAYNGLLRLTVPAEAFGDAMLRIASLGQPNVSDADAGYKPYSDAYSISAQEEASAPVKPLLLTLAYDSASLRVDNENAQKLGIFREDSRMPGTWIYVGGRVDAEAGVIEASISEYGTYAVLMLDRSFDDILGHWSRREAEVLISRGILNGVSDRQFAPDRIVTRAEIAKMLVEVVRKFGGPAIQLPSAAEFADVDPGAWYAEYVQDASDWGLVQGHGGTFRPHDPVTREELAVMITRASALLGKDGMGSDNVLASYRDGGSVSSWARSYFEFAIQAGLIQGVETGVLAPQRTASRAEAAVVIYRLLVYLEML